MRQDEEMIRGTVQTVVYQNPENGYAVLRLHTEDGQQITVVGTVPMTVPGERLIVTGNGAITQAMAASLRRSSSNA